MHSIVIMHSIVMFEKRADVKYQRLNIFCRFLKNFFITAKIKTPLYYSETNKQEFCHDYTGFAGIKFAFSKLRRL